jgi:hypothetical protein
MGNSLTEVSGYLTFSELSPAQTARLRELARDSRLCVDSSEKHFELEYKGRNTSHVIEALLMQVAAIVGSAEGEILLEAIDDEEGDPSFRFFRIHDHRLFVQNGRVSRGPVSEYRPEHHGRAGTRQSR